MMHSNSNAYYRHTLEMVSEILKRAGRLKGEALQAAVEGNTPKAVAMGFEAQGMVRAALAAFNGVPIIRGGPGMGLYAGLEAELTRLTDERGPYPGPEAETKPGAIFYSMHDPRSLETPDGQEQETRAARIARRLTTIVGWLGDEATSMALHKEYGNETVTMSAKAGLQAVADWYNDQD